MPVVVTGKMDGITDYEISMIKDIIAIALVNKPGDFSGMASEIATKTTAKLYGAWNVICGESNPYGDKDSSFGKAVYPNQQKLVQFSVADEEKQRWKEFFFVWLS